MNTIRIYLRPFLFTILFIFLSIVVKSQILIEAESFHNPGGWVIDQQFMDQMGSPFLMAHGLGKPVKDATTEIDITEEGTYAVYVRTRNWIGYWNKNQAPGVFRLIVNKDTLATLLGNQSTEWSWQKTESIHLDQGKSKLALHDLTGFNGRCDAIILSKDAAYTPSNDPDELKALRKRLLHLPDAPDPAGTYDFVVVGGGMAGTCAAISAARLGLKVAFIQDRPVLGGNNSSEVRVHLGGRIKLEPYPNLGNLVNEIGPEKGGNARPYSYYEDDKKISSVKAEKNIDLFLNYHANKVIKEQGRIKGVIAQNVLTGEEKSFHAGLFADCTGDGTIGALAGADFMMGRESRSEFGEPTAPEKEDKMTMGSSIQWYADSLKKKNNFPEITWAIPIDEKSVIPSRTGDWNWETGMNLSQLNDLERIRDYGLLVAFSNWSYLKNKFSKKEHYANWELKWVAYIAGKRESRRIVGDLILKEQDLTQQINYPDGTASTSWTVDLHYPDPKNSVNFPGQEFLSIAKHKPIHPYPIPFRCLYSKSIPNLMMAGRDISVTHVALGTVRVMRTTGMMGEVIGMAAAVCKKHSVDPREMGKSYFQDLKALMEKGIGKADLPNRQKYNQGGTLKKE